MGCETCECVENICCDGPLCLNYPPVCLCGLDQNKVMGVDDNDCETCQCVDDVCCDDPLCLNYPPTCICGLDENKVTGVDDNGCETCQCVDDVCCDGPLCLNYPPVCICGLDEDKVTGVDGDGCATCHCEACQCGSRYEIVEDSHCGGGANINTWDDGTSAQYGDARWNSIEECKLTCSEHEECMGFVYRHK
eukprot:UN26806